MQELTNGRGSAKMFLRASMETDAAPANPQRGRQSLRGVRLAAAETAPEQRRETRAAGLPPLPGPRAKVKVEPCLLNQQFNAPLEHNVRGCVFSPLNAKKERET